MIPTRTSETKCLLIGAEVPYEMSEASSRSGISRVGLDQGNGTSTYLARENH